MRKVELIKGIESSALGFGCAPIMGSVDSKKAKYAIECALDNGINHFDLARSYGYGDAERFVGKIVKNKRDKVVLASKFGIYANWKANLLKPVKPLVRYARENLKKEHNKETKNNHIPKIADHFHNRLVLRKTEMLKSVEKSLRELNTDYLDYLFIHEPIDTLTYFDELAELAEVFKKEGKIRGWGLAYMQSQQSLHETYLNKFDVLQFNNSSGTFEYDDVVKSRGLMSNIIFSPLNGGDKNKSPKEKFNKIFEDFPNSVVLCSMFDEKHIIENVKLVY
ncbi:aldo/keto reductase [Flavobacterium hydrophilum]|uniref:Aldo/keto reductase n=1 Tax=Flavobacterium hydrophilum TaxID=2211445 RepID=A0A2V4C3Y5_9FLAO|nr:aldo/keto reductase [Flavobacterium hydrophilum]PXY45707.1 aldo/keto reductase [Flavobacterium hydrophilum]